MAGLQKQQKKQRQLPSDQVCNRSVTAGRARHSLRAADGAQRSDALPAITEALPRYSEILLCFEAGV